MQRIYGTAFFTPKELDEYLTQLEEAKKRDHRKLGQELDLFSIQELAGPGLIFFHPKGGTIRKILEDWMRDQYVKRGYSLVYTPHIARVRPVEDLRPLQFLRREHVQADGAGRRRIPAQADELPVPHPDLRGPDAAATATCRCASGELGTVYRYERSGVMHGLLRVRGFTQDDAHIFCTPGADRRRDRELPRVRRRHAARPTASSEYEAELSTWDGGASGKYDGTPEQWAACRKRADARPPSGSA